MRPAVLVAFLSLFIVAATANSPQCACPPGAKDCGCCEQVVLKFPYIHKTFNETVCANVSWDGNSLVRSSCRLPRPRPSPRPCPLHLGHRVIEYLCSTLWTISSFLLLIERRFVHHDWRQGRHQQERLRFDFPSFPWLAIPFDWGQLLPETSECLSEHFIRISYVAASSSICYGLPYGAEICAGVENLYINQANGTVSGCLDLSAVILGVTVFDWKLGCFNIHVPKVGKVSAVIPGLSHEKLSSARSRTLISCS